MSCLVGGLLLLLLRLGLLASRSADVWRGHEVVC